MNPIGRRTIITWFYGLFFSLLSIRWNTIDFSGKDLTIADTLDLFQIVFSRLTSNVHVFEISILFLSLFLFKSAHRREKGYLLYLFFLSSMIGALFLNQSNWSLGIAFFIYALVEKRKWPFLGAIISHPGFIPFVGIARLKKKHLVPFVIAAYVLFRLLIVYIIEIRAYLSFSGYSVQDVKFSLEPVAYVVLIYLSFFFIRGRILHLDDSKFRIPYLTLALSLILGFHLGLEVLFYRTLTLSIVMMFFYITNSRKNYTLVLSGISLWFATVYFYEFKLGFLRFVFA